jgi:hypothetical protein
LHGKCDQFDGLGKRFMPFGQSVEAFIDGHGVSSVAPATHVVGSTSR